jgi:hypothetical protein
LAGVSGDGASQEFIMKKIACTALKTIHFATHV